MYATYPTSNARRDNHSTANAGTTQLTIETPSASAVPTVFNACNTTPSKILVVIIIGDDRYPSSSSTAAASARASSAASSSFDASSSPVRIDAERARRGALAGPRDRRDASIVHARVDECRPSRRRARARRRATREIGCKKIHTVASAARASASPTGVSSRAR